MTSEVAILAHAAAGFEGAYRLDLRADGRLLGIGRNPLQMAALRLMEEGYVPATVIRIVFADGSVEQRGTIAEGMSG